MKLAHRFVNNHSPYIGYHKSTLQSGCGTEYCYKLFESIPLGLVCTVLGLGLCIIRSPALFLRSTTSLLAGLLLVLPRAPRLPWFVMALTLLIADSNCSSTVCFGRLLRLWDMYLFETRRQTLTRLYAGNFGVAQWYIQNSSLL